MDLKQRKLSKSEWDSIEIPVSADEIEILRLIMNGYDNVSIKYNQHNSLFTFLKIEYSKQMEDYLYNKFFAKKITEIISKYGVAFLQIDVKDKHKIIKVMKK